MYRKKKRKEKGKETPNYYCKAEDTHTHNTHTESSSYTVVTKYKLQPKFKGCALR